MLFWLCCNRCERYREVLLLFDCVCKGGVIVCIGMLRWEVLFGGGRADWVFFKNKGKGGERIAPIVWLKWGEWLGISRVQGY